MGVEVGLDVREVLARFGFTRLASVKPHGGGHINASYRVEGPGPGGPGEYLLQRLNPAVFRDPGAVMRNMARVTEHLASSLASLRLPDAERRVLRLFSALNGEIAVQAADGATWRLVRFIPETRTIDTVVDPQEAREVGAAFGMFHRLVAQWPGEPLETSLADFHHAPSRLVEFEETLRRNPAGRVGSVASEIGFVRTRHAAAESLTELLAGRSIPTRIVHNDAKPSNVLLDAESGQGLAVVDLDTVMMGTVLHDVGDLIRSASSSAGEDEADLARVQVEPELFLAWTSGFLSAGGKGILNEEELRFFVPAGLLITYEQGVRFLTDHLAGDTYYRISRPGQNLDRARVQFRLLTSLESLQADLERTLRDLTRSLW